MGCALASPTAAAPAPAVRAMSELAPRSQLWGTPTTEPRNLFSSDSIPAALAAELPPPSSALCPAYSRSDRVGPHSSCRCDRLCTYVLNCHKYTSMRSLGDARDGESQGGT